MSETSIERQPPEDYPRNMESRVAVLEALAERTDSDLRELKSMVQTVITNITNLRVDIQSVRTELKTEIQSVRAELKIDIQSTRTDLERGLRVNLTKTVAWFGLMFTVTAAIVTILVKLPHF